MEKVSIYILLFVLVTSCEFGKKVYSIDDYHVFMNNPENGYTLSKTTNGVEVNLKFLTSDYLAYKDFKELGFETSIQYDSLCKEYENSFTFFLTISPNENKMESGVENGVMMKDIYKIEDFKERAINMNFSMGEYIQLRNKEASIHPVLTNLENTYEVVSGKSIYVVFSKEMIDNQLKEGKEIEFVYNDELFDSGISVFSFKKELFENTPSIILN